ncbi:hypothetical protein B1199_14190 [Pseudoalteromonas ulvae]|uniref:Uncharacterized protein n=1 Tax=Pseudoalteromonas ulvae TaxID=107327 RepID=A0A244CNV5_PSEDV|nr:hypothetical protein B1199_14190 [Pseudoalteromonas ulvae]
MSLTIPLLTRISSKILPNCKNLSQFNLSRNFTDVNRIFTEDTHQTSCYVHINLINNEYKTSNIKTKKHIKQVIYNQKQPALHQKKQKTYSQQSYSK